MIGAGGAVSGVLASLLAEAPGALHVTNRTHAKAQKLEQRFAGATAVAMDRLQESYDLVINGTSAGLSHQDLEISWIGHYWKHSLLRHDLWSRYYSF